VLVLGYTNTYEKTRLCVASKSIRQVIERRAKRAIQHLNSKHYDNENSIYSWNTNQIITVGGEPIEKWKREREREQVEKKLKSYLKQFHELQHSMELNCVLVRKEEGYRGTKKNSCCLKWRMREKLVQYDNHGDDHEDDNDLPSLRYNEDEDRHYEDIVGGIGDRRSKNCISWTLEGRHAIHYLRATEPILPTSSSSERYYIVRVRQRFMGCIELGIITQEFHNSPGWGQYNSTVGGNAGPHCAFFFITRYDRYINGDNVDEVDFGLVVNTATGSIKHGVPIESYNGRRIIINNGVFENSIINFKYNQSQPLYFALLVSRPFEQKNFHAFVSIQEVSSEQKWLTKMVPWALS